MESLMKVKMALKKFAGNNEVFILPVLKFLLTFLALSRISSQLGFWSRLASKPIVLIVALAGSFLPLNLTLVILALITVLHLKYLSMAAAIVGLALFLVLFLMYFRFASEDSIAGILTPLSFVYKMPMVIPVSMGLKGTPSSIVSVGCGVVIYQVLHYFAVNADEIRGDESANILGQFSSIIDGLLANKAMFAYAAAFGVTVIVVYVIRRLSIKYAWIIAIAVGELTMFLTLAVANSKLSAGISMGSAFGGIIVSTLLNLVLCYFCFDLNYDKIEKVQFEDDEYYYYVKAVPKNEILEKPKPSKKKKSNGPSREASVRTRPAGTATAQQVRQGSTQVRRETVAAPERRAVQPSAQRHSSEDAAAAIRNRVSASSSSSASKTPRAPFGLTGGRPAGEGRRLQEQREAQRRNSEE